jgi:hypothetical protein
VTMPRAWWLPRSAQLGDDGLVDVDAVGLDTGREEVSGRDRVQGGCEHEGDVDTVEGSRMASAADEGVADHVGQGPVVADGTAEDEGHSGAHALVEDARAQPAGLDGGGDGTEPPDLVYDAQMVRVPVLGRRVPSPSETPSDVPSTEDSMSWVAKPLPANSRSIHPSRTIRARGGCGTGVHDRGPADGEDAPPGGSPARVALPHSPGSGCRRPRHREGLRLLGGDLGGHEPETRVVGSRPGSSTRTPFHPTTT